jgi:hypothetical protein
MISAGLATKQQRYERRGELRARAARLRGWAARLREQAMGTASPEARSDLKWVAALYDQMGAEFDQAIAGTRARTLDLTVITESARGIGEGK